ncbi:DUF4424 family protein [Sideroxydans sp.]
MMKRLMQILSCCISMLFLIGANANDSIARVGVGGLELLTTDKIEMLSEVLEISTSKIRVTYRYLNTGNVGIKTVVAFPMPAFDSSRQLDGTRTNQRPLDSFEVFVNGLPVKVSKNRAFLIDSVDATDEFRKIGLSDDQIFDPMFSCLNVWDENATRAWSDNTPCRHSLSETQKQAIKNKIEAGGYWQVKETAYWEQMFPANKEIVVVHEYSPFVGSGYGTGDPKEFCIDKPTSRALAKRSPTNPDYPISHDEVEYILGTGRNWKGPIRNFKLQIHKSFPGQIVSLCFPGKPKRIDSTTIEFTQFNFVPQDEIAVTFIPR